MDSFSHNKGNANLVLMHGRILKGHQLLCDTRTVLEYLMGTAAILLTIILSHLFSFVFAPPSLWPVGVFKNFSILHYHPFPVFLFLCLSLLTVLFLFLGASIVCVNNQADLFL